MGAKSKTVQKETNRRLLIRLDAHVDEASTAEGFVSKRTALVVKDSTAETFLAVHPYLFDATEGAN